MTDNTPGIQLITNTRAPKTLLVETAVPLFIGYSSDLKAGKMHYLDHMDASSSTEVLYQTLRHFFASGGQGCYVFSLGAWDEKRSHPESDLQSAVLAQALGGETAITLMAFPDMTRIKDSDTATWCAIWRHFTALCQTRQGLFAVLDTPDSATEANSALTQFYPEANERAAAYWPRLYIDGDNSDEYLSVPASGAVMASIQRVDSQYGVWRAPANMALPQVIRPVYTAVGVEHLFSLQDVSCNLIRSFPGRGTRIWGCRTLTSDSQSPFRYIQMRRLVDYVERSLGLLARMYLFEPNSEVTWYKIKGQFHNWLRRLWQQGGLSGGQEHDAFTVSMGLNETMTQDDIQAGNMIVQVRITPLNPTEFIDITLQLNAQASTITQISSPEPSHATQ